MTTAHFQSDLNSLKVKPELKRLHSRKIVMVKFIIQVLFYFQRDREQMIKIKRMKREASVYVILRRKGYSINQLSKLFGRSTSMIHRILKFNGLTGYSWIGAAFFLKKSLHKLDKRKLKGEARLSKHLFTFLDREIWQKWESFMLGETDKPP